MTELELEALLRTQASALAAQPLPPGLRERLLAPHTSLPRALRSSAPVLGLFAAQVALSVAATLVVVALRSGAPPSTPAGSPPSAAGIVAGAVGSPATGIATTAAFDRVVVQGRHAMNDAWLPQISACRRLAGAPFPVDAAACRSTTLALGQAAVEFLVTLRATPPPPYLGMGGAALSTALGDLQTDCARLVGALDARDPAALARAEDHLGYQPMAVDMALMEN